jgi:hypothetical protein
LLVLHFCSFSGRGRVRVTIIFFSKGCQYLIYECLQSISTLVNQNAKLKIIDA